MTDRKKPGVTFWATVAVVVALVAYPLSIGPVMWWVNDQAGCPKWLMSALGYFYWPITGLTTHSRWCSDILDWYLSVWDSGRGH